MEIKNLLLVVGTGKIVSRTDVNDFFPAVRQSFFSRTEGIDLSRQTYNTIRLLFPFPKFVDSLLDDGASIRREFGLFVRTIRQNSAIGFAEIGWTDTVCRTKSVVECRNSGKAVGHGDSGY